MQFPPSLATASSFVLYHSGCPPSEGMLEQTRTHSTTDPVSRSPGASFAPAEKLNLGQVKLDALKVFGSDRHFLRAVCAPSS